MIYLNDNYKNYKYLVEVSDNYICLTDEKNIVADWEHPHSIDVVYQFFKPSTYVVEDVKTYTSDRSFETVKTSQDFWDRGDSPALFSVSVLVIACTLFLINILTKIVKRGGILA